MASVTYFGWSKDGWDLVFGAANALALLVGVPFALRAFRLSIVQRMNESLTKLLDEYRGPDFRDGVRHTIEKIPLFEGTLEEQLRAFVTHGKRNLTTADVVHARTVVHKLNDLGAFVEQGGVTEANFYGQTFPRVLEMAARLEPLVLCVSAAGGYRWGMRLRRMRIGAERYVRYSRVHSMRGFRVGKVLLVPPGRMGWGPRALCRLRQFLGLRSFLPSLAARAGTDNSDLETARRVLAEFDDADKAFLADVI